jgi:hypothetical protein
LAFFQPIAVLAAARYCGAALHQFVDDFAGYKLVDLHRTLLRLYFAEWILIDDRLLDMSRKTPLHEYGTGS